MSSSLHLEFFTHDSTQDAENPAARTGRGNEKSISKKNIIDCFTKHHPDNLNRLAG